MLRVLVIDDDVPILQAVGDVLRGEGILVREESQSDRAAEAARDFAPDLVLLDLMMPHLDGILVARALRREPGLSEIPLVLMSAHPRAARFAHEIGARACLRKPFSARRLLAAVEGGNTTDSTQPEITIP